MHDGLCASMAFAAGPPIIINSRSFSETACLKVRLSLITVSVNLCLNWMSLKGVISEKLLGVDETLREGEFDDLGGLAGLKTLCLVPK